MSNYEITLEWMQCLLPSASVDPNATEIAHMLGDFVQDIGSSVSGAVQEFDAGTGGKVEVVSAAAGDVMERTGQFMSDLDRELRNSGAAGDQLYITSSPSPGAPYGSPGLQVWPAAGTESSPVPPRGEPVRAKARIFEISRGEDTSVWDLAAGSTTRHLSCVLPEEHGLVFWEWDDVSAPDALFALRAQSAFLGSNDDLIYSGKQDCLYRVRWTLAQV